MSRSILITLCTALLLIVSLPARAQIEQGRMNGTVFDGQGGVIPGVTVTARSSALIGFQTSTTERDGRYRFPSLPPGQYTLVFELAGFQSVTRENVTVTTGNTMTADVQLQLATLAETVTVTGQSAVVDMSTTKVGTELSADKLASIPSATDMWR